MRVCIWVFLLVFCSGAGGCSSNQADNVETNVAKSSASTDMVYSVTAMEVEKAQTFFEESFQELLARRPMFQTRLGIKKNYDKWDDLSEEKGIADNEIRKRQLATLRSTIDYEQLDASTKLSYDLFVAYREQEIENFDFRLYDYTVNQMYGWQSRVPAFLINMHTISTVPEAEAYIGRLQAVDPLMRQVVAGLRLRADYGVIAPKFVFAHVIRDCENVLSGKPFDDSDSENVLLEDFRSKVEMLKAADTVKAELIDQAIAAMQGAVRAGYEHLLAYVTELEELATTDDGVWRLPRGGNYYAHRLKRITTTTLTADEIHELGLREVDRIHAEMLAIMNDVGFEGTLQEFFTFMREDERFYYPNTPEGKATYLANATEIIDSMKRRLDELFITKPKADLIVKAVEPFREKSAGRAFYERPAPDGSRPGTYYANLYDMKAMAIYEMEALAYHEGIPGHHMQISLSQEMDGLPTFRKHARFTAYTEGWALYTEFVPKEIGLYSDPYSDFGRLSMELWRACRLVVDTGIHDRKWTREEAIAYLRKNTPGSDTDTRKAIERYIVMPGQATAYKIGMLKIQELRAVATERLGEQFDIREFHDVVLRNGAVPMVTLENIVDEWVSSKQELQ